MNGSKAFVQQGSRLHHRLCAHVHTRVFILLACECGELEHSRSRLMMPVHTRTAVFPFRTSSIQHVLFVSNGVWTLEPRAVFIYYAAGDVLIAFFCNVW
jgi:hypothetical protein